MVVNHYAHSSECRFRGEVVCSSRKLVACLVVSLELHLGSASSELVLRISDHFSTFLCGTFITSDMVYLIGGGTIPVVYP